MMEFQKIRDFTRTLPQGSATNEVISWVHAKELTSSIIHKDKTTYAVEFSVKSLFDTAARTAVVAFAMPALAGVGMLYNFTIGFFKIGVGVVAHFRNPQDLTVKQEISEGFQHLLTAVYDVAIGVFHTIFALAYGIVPTLCEQAHQSSFIKQGVDGIMRGTFLEQRQPWWQIWK